MFELLGQVLASVLGLIPRLVIVRATHRGIKFRRGWKPIELKPGLHIYWPLISQVDIIVTARQTNQLAHQVLITKDGESIVVGGYVVFYMADAVRAAGQKNWDVDSTVDDIARAAIVDVVCSHTLDELREGVGNELTRQCRRKLNQFGVGVRKAGFTDLCKCRVHRVVGGGMSHV